MPPPRCEEPRHLPRRPEQSRHVGIGPTKGVVTCGSSAAGGHSGRARPRSRRKQQRLARQLPIGSWSARYRLWPDRKRACPSAAHWHLAGRLTQGPERPDASERSMLAVWARRYPAVASVGHSQVGRCRAGVLYPPACWGPLGLQAAMSMTCGPRIQGACAQRRVQPMARQINWRFLLAAPVSTLKVRASVVLMAIDVLACARRHRGAPFTLPRRRAAPAAATVTPASPASRSAGRCRAPG